MNPSGSHLQRRRFPLVRASSLILLVAIAGCTQQVQRGSAVAVAPMLSVERFLQASNARDYDAMARLFGDAGGPIANTGGTLGCAFRRIGSWFGMGNRCLRYDEVELRMAAISEVLRHRDYRVVSERAEPGRRTPTNRVGVDITRGQGDVVRDVRFLVVQTSRGWLIQEIDLQRMTGR